MGALSRRLLPKTDKAPVFIVKNVRDLLVFDIKLRILQKLKKILIFFKKGIDKSRFVCYNTQARERSAQEYGGIAQLARAPGSYPVGRRFKSHIRYQKPAKN